MVLTAHRLVILTALITNVIKLVAHAPLAAKLDSMVNFVRRLVTLTVRVNRVMRRLEHVLVIVFRENTGNTVIWTVRFIANLEYV